MRLNKESALQQNSYKRKKMRFPTNMKQTPSITKVNDVSQIYTNEVKRMEKAIYKIKDRIKDNFKDSSISRDQDESTNAMSKEMRRKSMPELNNVISQE